MPAAAGQLLPCADRWQVLHPAHPLRGQPGGVSALPGIETGLAWHTSGAVLSSWHGGRRGTIGGLRRISFRAFAR